MSSEFLLKLNTLTTQMLYHTAETKSHKVLLLKHLCRLLSFAVCRGLVLSSPMNSCHSLKAVNWLCYQRCVRSQDLFLSKGDQVLVMGSHTPVHRWVHGEHKTSFSPWTHFFSSLTSEMLYILNRQQGTVLSLDTPFSLRPEICR